MLRFLADENFDNDIIRGVLRHQSDLDIIRVQDIGLLGAEDSTILERAAQEQRLLLTHDVTTVTRHAYERIKAGKPMPGVVEVNQKTPIRVLIEEILLLVTCSQEGEWENRVINRFYWKKRGTDLFYNQKINLSPQWSRFIKIVSLV